MDSMTKKGTPTVVINRGVMATVLRRAFERRSARGIPEPGSLSYWIFRGMLEGMFRSVEEIGKPRYGVSFEEMASTSQELFRWEKEGSYRWGGGLREPMPWSSAAVAKAKFYEWRKATQDEAWQDVEELGPEAGLYRLSLELFGKNKIGYFTVKMTFDDGSPAGQPVLSLPGPQRRPGVPFKLIDLIPEVPGLDEPRVAEVDLYGANLAVNTLLFDALVVLYVNHEYAIEGVPFAGMATWYAHINWGDGDEEDFECGEIVSHIYRAAIDRSAITLTVISPEPKSRTVLIEVRRRGFRETELDVMPPPKAR
jgi:hypothetical protein